MLLISSKPTHCFPLPNDPAFEAEPELPKRALATDDKSYPAMEQVNEFLKIVDDPSTGKFYVHCARGRHRTGGSAGDVSLHPYGWNLDQALAVMDQYGFNSGFGHGKQRTSFKLLETISVKTSWCAG